MTDKKTKPEDAQALQQRFMEYQVQEQRIKQMQEHAQKLEMQSHEVDNVLQSLDDLSGAKEGDEVLVPISGGIFFKTKLADSSRFLVNVGAGVVVEKTLEETKQLIRNQEAELKRFKEHLTEQLVEAMMEHQILENDLQKLMDE